MWMQKVCFSMARAKIPTVKQVEKEWNDYSHQYDTFDLGPQTFFYSLASILNLQSASNILEVACGTGKLLPFALQRKNPAAKYIASDLAPNMIDIARKNLKTHLQRYESKLSFEDWCNQEKLSFEIINAEEPISGHSPFDRILCNCALMITEDPLKMLTNLGKQSKKGCLFGLSIWGNKDLNNLIGGIRESILESGYELPPERSNFHLYKKVGKIAEQAGWQVVLNWQQNALFPVLQYHPERNKELFHFQINKLPVEQREKVRETLEKKIAGIFTEKKGLNFACELYVLRKL